MDQMKNLVNEVKVPMGLRYIMTRLIKYNIDNIEKGPFPAWDSNHRPPGTGKIGTINNVSTE